MNQQSARSGSSRIRAVLGPTNTGKTHLAVERMLGHASGVIGLPLRLLAREIYDRVVTLRGRRSVALITGEEKILPPNPAYFVCTVEAMPMTRDFDFLAVDEIQLAADAERGHIFTDRLLHARGKEETMFLGAATMKSFLRRLLPDALIEERPRFSTLRHNGHRKLSRLGRRTAVVAFSADDVYAIAEAVRRHRGGAAIVMGALSPRTRNAQIAMYQAGEVDFLVATDAIGMGLNMDIDHVAFAGLRKFDGKTMRHLTAAEVSQIAGRAGRHMNDGSFGTTAELGLLDENLANQVEQHAFKPLEAARWRSGNLAYTSLRDLMRSLDTAPPKPFLIRPRDVDDTTSLKALSRNSAVSDRASRPAAIRLLWQVCQIPDFRKTLPEHHVALLARIFGHLVGSDNGLPTDWIAGHVNPLDRTDGDIDALANRIAAIRTWTYMAHQSDWIGDSVYWQERTREVEDRLSDALHARLAQRFVDRRTSLLVNRLNQGESLLASVNEAGAIAIEGEPIGQVHGLSFTLDRSVHLQHRGVRTAVKRALADTIARLARRLEGAADSAFSLDPKGQIHWQGAPVASLTEADRPLSARARLLAIDYLEGPRADAVRQRLQRWIDDRIARLLQPLIALDGVPFSSAARGVAYQLMEAHGVLWRDQIDDPVRRLEPKDFGRFKYNGVVIGETAIFLPALLKPEPTVLRCLLWALKNGQCGPSLAPPSPGLVSIATDDATPADFYRVAGFRCYGATAVRVDMAERLAHRLRQLSKKAPITLQPELLSLLGSDHGTLEAVMKAMGYVRSETDGETEPHFVRAQKRHRPVRQQAAAGRRRKRPPAPSQSPFAVLRDLQGK
jgi:ATP-dependent RNA helicase SUPV3L1/SUV3